MEASSSLPRQQSFERLENENDFEKLTDVQTSSKNTYSWLRKKGGKSQVPKQKRNHTVDLSSSLNTDYVEDMTAVDDEEAEKFDSSSRDSLAGSPEIRNSVSNGFGDVHDETRHRSFDETHLRSSVDDSFVKDDIVWEKSIRSDVSSTKQGATPDARSGKEQNLESGPRDDEAAVAGSGGMGMRFCIDN